MHGSPGAAYRPSLAPGPSTGPVDHVLILHPAGRPGRTALPAPAAVAHAHKMAVLGSASQYYYAHAHKRIAQRARMSINDRDPSFTASRWQ